MKRLELMNEPASIIVMSGWMFRKKLADPGLFGSEQLLLPRCRESAVTMYVLRPLKEILKRC